MSCLFYLLRRYYVSIARTSDWSWKSSVEIPIMSTFYNYLCYPPFVLFFFFFSFCFALLIFFFFFCSFFFFLLFFYSNMKPCPWSPPSILQRLYTTISLHLAPCSGCLFCLINFAFGVSSVFPRFPPYQFFVSLFRCIGCFSVTNVTRS